MTDEHANQASTPPLHAQDTAPGRSRVRIIPPFIYGGALLLAIVLELLYGINVFTWGVQLALGVLLISFGAGLLTWCIELFGKTGTPLNPNKPTREIVTKGPYSLSRNPIYIALTVIYLGLCVLCDLLWGILLVAPLVFIIRKFVIEREEHYLEEKFGESYLAYKNKVKRWF